MLLYPVSIPFDTTHNTILTRREVEVILPTLWTLLSMLGGMLLTLYQMPDLVLTLLMPVQCNSARTHDCLLPIKSPLPMGLSSKVKIDQVRELLPVGKQSIARVFELYSKDCVLINRVWDRSSANSHLHGSLLRAWNVPGDFGVDFQWRRSQFVYMGLDLPQCESDLAGFELQARLIHDLLAR